MLADLIVMIVMVGNTDFIVSDMWWVVMAMLRIARFVMVDVVLEMVMLDHWLVSMVRIPLYLGERNYFIGQLVKGQRELYSLAFHTLPDEINTLLAAKDFIMSTAIK